MFVSDVTTNHWSFKLSSYFKIEATVERLRVRGVVFEEYDFPGLRTVNGIAEVAGNYPSKGGVGEKAAWFRDSEGNLFGIGQRMS